MGLTQYQRIQDLVGCNREMRKLVDGLSQMVGVDRYTLWRTIDRLATHRGELLFLRHHIPNQGLADMLLEAVHQVDHMLEILSRMR